MYLNFLLTFLAVSTSVSALVKSPGICPTISGQQDFQNQKFVGSWFQYSAYSNSFTNGKCVYVEFTGLEGFTSVSIAKSVDKELETTTGSYTNDATNPAKVTAVLDGVTYDETIAATDYEGYAVLYICKAASASEKEEGVWILTREHPVPAATEKSIQDYIAKNDFIKPANLEKTSYDDCEINIVPN